MRSGKPIETLCEVTERELDEPIGLLLLDDALDIRRLVAGGANWRASSSTP